ncbi:MAG: phosphatase PAP2 family protein [Flavobacteriales bacterium]|nr:phosphatase PAP2 family protein [Flavobacteriales bacterium]
MLETLERWDHELLLFLNGHHAPWLDTVMYVLTQTLASGPWLIFLVYLLYKKGGWRYLGLVILGVGMVILISDQTSVHLFKNVFLRYRPSHNLELDGLLHHVNDFHGNIYKGGQYGFLSSHATNFFGLAMFIWLSLRPARRALAVLIFGWAALISYTRIYLGVHFPSDIIAGALWGSLIGMLVWVGKEFLRKRYIHTKTE